jgi:hypothetical protein
MVKKRETSSDNDNAEQIESVERKSYVKASTDIIEENVEWFKKDGEKPCVRRIKIKNSLLDKDTSRHQKSYYEAFDILKQLSKKEKDASEARKEYGISGVQRRTQLNRLLERKHQSSEKFVAGMTATRIGAELGIKPPWILLHLLMRYKLINTYQQKDANITTQEERNKLKKNIDKEKKKGGSNQEKIRKLSDELTDLEGKEYLYFKIMDKGNEAINMVKTVDRDDPMRLFFHLLDPKAAKDADLDAEE